jgi:hypothetical protein
MLFHYRHRPFRKDLNLNFEPFLHFKENDSEKTFLFLIKVRLENIGN